MCGVGGCVGGWVAGRDGGEFVGSANAAVLRPQAGDASLHLWVDADYVFPMAPLASFALALPATLLAALPTQPALLPLFHPIVPLLPLLHS